MEEELDSIEKKKKKVANFNEITPEVLKTKFDDILQLFNTVSKQNTIENEQLHPSLPQKGDLRIIKNSSSSSRHQHGSPWPFPATLPIGLQGYILYRHRAVVYRF